MTSSYDSILVTVRGCQRCGHDHENLSFARLDNAIDEWKYWAMCPEKKQPVLLRISDDEGRKQI